MMNCVKLIENMWYIHQAKEILHALLREIWVKRYILGKVKTFYYNMNTYEKRWTKPHLFGQSEPFEWTKYILLQDERTNYYYYSLNSKWKNSKKPDSVLLCFKCNFNLANVYCKECKGIYCYDCFEVAHPDVLFYIIIIGIFKMA